MESKTLYLFFFKKLRIIPDFFTSNGIRKKLSINPMNNFGIYIFEIRIPVDFSEVSPEWNECMEIIKN